MKSISSILCLAVACAAPLLGPQHVQAQDAMPSQLAQLSGFVGDGACTGNFLVTKSPHKTSARYHGEKTLGDYWIAVRYDEETTSSNSRPYSVTQYFGYDAKAGHFVDVLLDNSGGSYGAGTSSGWQGDTITFENTDFTSGSHPLFRDVFTRRGDKVISHTGYQRAKSGKWVKTDAEICKRM